MSFLLGVCTSLHSTISIVLNRSDASEDHSNYQNKTAVQCLKVSRAHSRGNMKDTNKGFNKLTIITNRKRWRERGSEKQVKYYAGAEKRKRKMEQIEMSRLWA